MRWWPMEVGAPGRAGAGGQEQAGGGFWGHMAVGLLPLWPGGLWHLTVPGGPTEAEGREGRLWRLPSACDIQAL